jgi:hypothetical protein
MVKVKLHEIAHSRAGDKGNRLNIGLFPYQAEAWPSILAEVTADRVLALFKHRGATKVERYILPKLPGMNFVIDEALEGGVNSSLALDTHGKTHSFRLLGLEIEIDEMLASALGVDVGGVQRWRRAESSKGHGE